MQNKRTCALCMTMVLLLLCALPANLWAQHEKTVNQSSQGFIVHVGCGDGQRTGALLVNDSCLVHGLDTDAGQIKQARRYIQELGIYGPVSVERFDGKRLPYSENLVNLVAVISGVCANGLSTVVPAKNHENVLMLLDELLPDLLAGVTFGLHSTPGVS